MHTETAEFIPDVTVLSILFNQIQHMIRNRQHPKYITHIRCHTGLPGPLAQDKAEIIQFLMKNVLTASEFHKKHYVDSKSFTKTFPLNDNKLRTL